MSNFPRAKRRFESSSQGPVNLKRIRKYGSYARAYAGGRKFRTYARSSYVANSSRTSGFRKGGYHIINRGLTYFPTMYTTTLRFTGIFRESAVSGAQDILFRGNAPYDPFYDAGGEEAAGWDELSAIYNYYRVNSSAIRLTVVNLDTDDPVHLAIYPDSSINDNTLVGAFSQPGVKTGIATAEQGHGFVSNFATTYRTLGPHSNDADSWASVGAVPTRGWYWHAVMKNYSGNALNLEYRVEILYNCDFWEVHMPTSQL